ncbi:hypothetical protein [Aurantiacibacter sp. MUD61]|uniref:hypothetical protein n=1 Tax=Aurantiacibacter sp. MUD61 TaxID=3009083 RepID=UPI0022F0F883|nr:hypothetical protein [Aurantiacibacter sp. MUD61]
MGITIGVAFVALALDFVRVEESMPLLLRWFVGLMGAIVAFASFAHLRLRFRRHLAYSNGREKRGTVRLRGRWDSESGSTVVSFTKGKDEWVMGVDQGTITALRDAGPEGLPATAYFGEDERIYGLDVAGKRAMPLSAGVPLKGKMRERIEGAERRFSRLAEKHGQPETKS